MLTDVNAVKARREDVIRQLDDYIKKNKGSKSITEYEDFGFNGKLPQYFEHETYKEIFQK